MTDQIQVGKTYSVEYAVDNIGENSGTQTIELKDAAANVLDTEDISLASGADTTGTLTWAPSSSDTGTQTLTLESDNDTENIDVKVVEPDVTVTITGTNSPVQPGDTVNVNVDVSNTGNQTVDETVVLSFTSLASLDGALVTLSPSQTKSITLEWDTASDQTTRDYDLSVSVSDDSASTTVIVDSAEPVIDDFEDGDLTEYSFAKGASAASVIDNSTEAFAGDQYLHYDGSALMQMGSTSGLNYYPEPGDIFAFNLYIEDASSGGQRFGWGFQNDTFGEGYVVDLNFTGGGGFELGKYGNNISNSRLDLDTLSNTDWASESGKWLAFEVRWETNGDMTATVWESPSRNNQLAQVGANDTTYSDGGIGIQGQDSGKWRFDYYRKTGDI